MAELRVETRADGAPPQFLGPTGDLVHFLSFAVAERYGATHELSGVARVLRTRSADTPPPLVSLTPPGPGTPSHPEPPTSGHPAPPASPAHPEPVEGRAPRDRLRPLLTFAEDNLEDADDRRDMEQIWQPAGPVAEGAAWAAREIRGSPRLLDLIGGFPDLLPRLDDLEQIAAWSAERRAEIRLLFRL